MTTPSAPGTQIVTRSTPPSRSLGSLTGVWHIAATAERGPTNGTRLLHNLGDYDKVFGGRVAYGQRDAIEAYFRNGGGAVNMVHIVGPAATVATVNLPGAAAAPSLAADAIGGGTSTLSVDVDTITGDRFVISVYQGTSRLELSPPLDTVDAAVSWSQQSSLIRLRALGTAVPLATTEPVPLAGGTDDLASITDEHRVAALSLIPRGDGPGQVSIPGATTTTAHIALLRHAVDNNRFALLDAPDTAVEADLVSAAAAVRAGSTDMESGHGFFCESWHSIPGLTVGTTRKVAPSSIVAALMSARDASTNNPNEPAAGVNGVPPYSLGPARAEWSDAARGRLNEAGVNVFRYVAGQHRLYGYRTLVDPRGAGAAWLSASNARLRMAMQAEAERLAEPFVFSQITKSKISEYHGVITGMCLDFYQRGALFGDTPEEAFVVDTGPQVNTPEKIANRQLSAVVGARMSEFAEIVYMEFVKVSITEVLG